MHPWNYNLLTKDLFLTYMWAMCFTQHSKLGTNKNQLT